jgi:hypothetical protein
MANEEKSSTFSSLRFRGNPLELRFSRGRQLDVVQARFTPLADLFQTEVVSPCLRFDARLRTKRFVHESIVSSADFHGIVKISSSV